MAVEGLAAFRNHLTKKVPEALRDQIKRDLEKWAEELVAMMRRLVPRDQGRLAQSIGWTWGEAPAGSITIGEVGGRKYGTMRITVYAGDETTMVTNKRGHKFQNAAIQEFGTKARASSPYFWPSYRSLKKRGKSRVARNMRKVIKSLN